MAHRLKAKWLASVKESCREAGKVREVKLKVPMGRPSSVLHTMVTQKENDTTMNARGGGGGGGGALVVWQQEAAPLQ